MSFKQLKQEAELLDLEYIERLPPTSKLCKVRKTIVAALEFLHGIIPPIGKLKVVKAAILIGIAALNAIPCDDPITL